MIEEFHSDGWNVGKLKKPLGQGMNLQIECEDVLQKERKLKSKGVTLYQEIEENWYKTEKGLVGNKELLVQDPDGYLLRFAEDLGTHRCQLLAEISQIWNFWALFR